MAFSSFKASAAEGQRHYVLALSDQLSYNIEDLHHVTPSVRRVVEPELGLCPRIKKSPLCLESNLLHLNMYFLSAEWKLIYKWYTVSAGPQSIKRVVTRSCTTLNKEMKPFGPSFLCWGGGCMGCTKWIQKETPRRENWKKGGGT